MSLWNKVIGLTVAVYNKIRRFFGNHRRFLWFNVFQKDNRFCLTLGNNPLNKHGSCMLKFSQFYGGQLVFVLRETVSSGIRKKLPIVDTMLCPYKGTMLYQTLPYQLIHCRRKQDELPQIVHFFLNAINCLQTSVSYHLPSNEQAGRKWQPLVRTFILIINKNKKFKMSCQTTRQVS